MSAMVEAIKVELFGGPRHGHVIDLPFPQSQVLSIEALFEIDGVKTARRGDYTRVHDINGKSLPEFEWSGFTTPHRVLGDRDE